MQARALEEKIEGERVELEHEGELCRRIRWIIKEFALDIQTIRARLVNNLWEYTGGIVFTSEILPRNSAQERVMIHLARW